MKRLTERRKNGAINVRYATEHETAIHRLAAIEDILCDGTDEYDLDRLREIAEADWEGRCVVLPRLVPGQGDPPGELGPPGPPGIAD